MPERTMTDPETTTRPAGRPRMTNPIALWVIPVSDLAGVARHTLDAVRVGIPGWRTVVLCPQGPLADTLRDRDQAVITGDFGPASGMRTSLATLRRTIDTIRPRVIHTHLAYADIIAALALGPAGLRRRRGGPRLISTEHGIAPDDSMYHGTPLKSAVMARAHQARTLAFDELIAVCQSTRAVMAAKWHPRSPITVVFNGVDRPLPPPTPSPGLRIVSISRLAPEKGISRLLDAFAVLHSDRPDATLTLAGTGPLDVELRLQAARLGIGSAVEFPGYTAASDLLANHDVLVQLSVWENCSYTILDACTAGLGVVATPVGGNPEILPPLCLAPADDAVGVAALIRSQAAHLGLRPALPELWPTVADMTAGIAAVYEGGS